MNTKAKGARSERKVKKEQEKEGWYVVKAGGSLGLWDLVALHPNGTVKFLQVKSNRMPSTTERKRLQTFANKWPWADCLIALVVDRSKIQYVIL